MAALGELEFEMFGFLCQASAVIVSPSVQGHSFALRSLMGLSCSSNRVGWS